MEKKFTKKNKIARRFLGLYFGLFTGVCALAAAFAWFTGTISKPGIEVTTGKIEIAANAYKFENNTISKLGATTDPNYPLVLDIDQKEEKYLYIIVDRTVESLEVDYFLNLEVENGKGLTDSAFEEQTRYISGFSYSFYKLNSEVTASTVPQRTYDASSTLNDSEKKLDSYIYDCTSRSVNIHPNLATKSLATLTEDTKQDSLEDTTYANYYVFHYDYGSSISDLTNRKIQIKLNLNYAQLGGLTEESRRSETLYATTQNQFDQYIKEYKPGQTIHVSTDVNYNMDLVFNAPLDLVIDNCTLTVSGNLKFSYPYFEPSSINTKSNGKILVKSINNVGGYLEVDVPNGSFEFIGKGKGSTIGDIYVQKDVILKASYDDGVTISGANFFALTSTGAIPQAISVKDIWFENDTCITIGNNTLVGTIKPYLSSTSDSNSAPSRVAIIIYGTVSRINLSSMGAIASVQTREQIYVESYGVFNNSNILLPVWSIKWAVDPNNANAHIGNTTIKQHFTSSELTVTAVYSAEMIETQFKNDDIIKDVRTQYVVPSADGETAITIYYQTHDNDVYGSINSIDLTLKEYYFPSGYSSTLDASYKSILEGLTGVTVISSASDRITSNDSAIFRKMKNCHTFDMSQAKYVDDMIDSYCFGAMTSIKNLFLPETLVQIGREFVSGCSNLLEITIPASVTTMFDLWNYDGNSYLTDNPRVFHIKNTTTVFKPYNDGRNYYYMGVDAAIINRYEEQLGTGYMKYFGLDGLVTEDRKYVYNQISANNYTIERCLKPDFLGQDLYCDQFAINSHQTGNIKRIADYAYCWIRNVGDIKITSGIDYIGDHAFYYDGKAKMTIGDFAVKNVNYVGDFAFAHLSCDSIDISDIDNIGSEGFAYGICRGDVSFKHIGKATYPIYGLVADGDVVVEDIDESTIISITADNITLKDAHFLQNYGGMVLKSTNTTTIDNISFDRSSDKAYPFNGSTCKDFILKNIKKDALGPQAFYGITNTNSSTLINCCINLSNTFTNYAKLGDTIVRDCTLEVCWFNNCTFGDVLFDNCTLNSKSFYRCTIEKLSFMNMTSVSKNFFSDGGTIEILDLNGINTLNSFSFAYCTINSMINYDGLTTLNGDGIFYASTMPNNTTFYSDKITKLDVGCFLSSPFEIIDCKKVTKIGGNLFNYSNNLVIVYLGEIKDTNGSPGLAGQYLASMCTNLKYVFLCGDNTPFSSTEGLKNHYTNMAGNTDTSTTYKIIVTKSYYDTMGLIGDTIDDKIKYSKFLYYNGNMLNDLHIFGTQKISEEATANYGDGIFYFNSDRDSNNNPCVTILCLSVASISGSSYVTPGTIEYNNNTYKVSRIDFAYRGVDIDVDTFTVHSNTTYLGSLSPQFNTGVFNIDTFDGSSLTALGDGCFYRGTYGTVNLNNVTSIGNYCFFGYGTATTNMCNIGTLNLNGLVTSDAIRCFGLAAISEVNLNSLTTISNGQWFYFNSIFGDINANSLTSCGLSFDDRHYTVGSSFESININSLTGLTGSFYFYGTAYIGNFNANSLQTVDRAFYVTRGPEVFYLPSLTSAGNSYANSCFYFAQGTVKIYFPNLVTLNAFIYAGDDLREIILPKWSTGNVLLGRITTSNNLQVMYAPSYKLNYYGRWYHSDQVRLNNGVKDLFINTLVSDGGTKNTISLEFCNIVENIYFSDTYYTNTVKGLLNRSSFANKVNVYVLDSVYQDIPSDVLNNYGYNFINTGTHNPSEIYFNGTGDSIKLVESDTSYTYPEYHYLEEDNYVTLVQCCKTSYSGGEMKIGGNVTITKKVNGITTNVVKPIAYLGNHLYSHNSINVSKISIDSSVIDINENAFGVGASKTCSSLELKNTGIVKTGAFSGLNVTNNLAIYNLTTLESNSMPTINNINIQIFKQSSTMIPSTGAFGSGTKASRLYVPASTLALYSANSWNGIPVSNVTCFNSSFDVIDGSATVTYYYNLIGNGIDILYATSSSPLSIVHIPGTVTIGDSTKDVVILESEALCALGAITSIELPTTLRSYIFDKTSEPSSLTAYTIAGTSSYYSAVNGVLFSADGTRLISYPKGKADVSYTVPATVTTIASSAFANNTHIGSVTIAPTTSIAISDNAFNGCSGISSITVTGNSILDNYAFANTNISSATFTGTTRVGAYVFDNCDNLTTVNFGGKATIESFAFANTKENIIYNFTGSTVSEFIGRNIFQNVASYLIKVPTGTLASYYENVLYDMSILFHIQEVAA